MVANLEGSGERVVAIRKAPDFFPGDPAWSPDGKIIALAAGTLRGRFRGAIVGVSTEGGPEKPLTSRTWFQPGRVAWLADGSGLVFVAADKTSWIASQLWYLSYPGGETRKITNDLSSYNSPPRNSQETRTWSEATKGSHGQSAFGCL